MTIMARTVCLFLSTMATGMTTTVSTTEATSASVEVRNVTLAVDLAEIPCCVQ